VPKDVLDVMRQPRALAAACRRPTVGYVEIDLLGDEPLYEQLAAILRAQIASGELAAGRPIPSEQALMEQHGVSRGTAAHAVRLLRDEGLVRLVFGRGTFVTRQPG
jgi:GntR family transcriptional regulator